MSSQIPKDQSSGGKKPTNSVINKLFPGAACWGLHRLSTETSTEIKGSRLKFSLTFYRYLVDFVKPVKGPVFCFEFVEIASKTTKREDLKSPTARVKVILSLSHWKIK